jgi:hypothetical protein
MENMIPQLAVEHPQPTKVRGRPPHTMKYLSDKNRKLKELLEDKNAEIANLKQNISTINATIADMVKTAEEDEYRISHLNSELEDTTFYLADYKEKLMDAEKERDEYHANNINTKCKIDQMCGVEMEIEHMGAEDISETIERMERGLTRLREALSQRRSLGEVKAYAVQACFGCISVRKPYIMCSQCTIVGCEKCVVAAGAALTTCPACKTASMFKIPSAAMTPIYS